MKFPTRTHLHRLRILLTLGVFLLPLPARAAPKTDVITMQNGDIVTCELKEMVHGKVRAKTDDMGTVYIEWDEVARVVSQYRFLIKLNTGALVYGQLPDSGEDGVLMVVFEYETGGTRVNMEHIVGIESIRYDIWERIKLEISAGYNWTKASETSQANLAGAAKYKGRIYRYGLDGQMILTTERDNRTTRRQDLNLFWSREVSGRLQAGVSSSLERNDQLGLALRTSAGVNLGYLLLMSRHLEFGVQGGVSGTREWADLDAARVNAAEGVLTVNFTYFRYDSPKTNLSAKVEVYPSLTVADRVRLEFDTSLRYEVVTDLFVELKYYESRDNRPPAGAVATADRGVVFALGWTK